MDQFYLEHMNNYFGVQFYTCYKRQICVILSQGVTIKDIQIYNDRKAKFSNTYQKIKYIILVR